MKDILCTDRQVIQWDEDLISKYDSRGPRYTSYPTADLFKESYTALDYKKDLGDVKDKLFEPLSIYIHIPFCQDICYYCACNKVVTNKKEVAEEYLNYLEKEMALLHEHIGHQRRVVQLHLGGGTPTFLNAGQLTRLIHMLAKYFHLTERENREYSIEIDPRTVCTDTLALLKGLGFNRVSLGVQDFSPEVQEAVNRKNSFEMVEDLVIASRDHGFESLNFDLIYGLPKQNLESMNETLDQVIDLSPDRIAFYNYAHLPERFSSQRAIDRHTLPTADEKLQMLNLLSKRLTEAGYEYIGMDHFVKPDDSLSKAIEEGKLIRNFQGYSTSHATNLVGLGVSAISSGERYFSQNHHNVEKYYESLDKGDLPIAKGLQCNDDDLRRRDAIMTLIGNLSLDISLWEAKFGDSFSDYFSQELSVLKDMEQDQLVTVSEDFIEILPTGRAMLRNICKVFDKYHRPESQQFSKVI